MSNKKPDVIKCRHVVRKSTGEPGEMCDKVAEAVFNITDPEDGTTVIASLVLCSDHMAKLESGKTMIVMSKLGKPLMVKLDAA